MYGLMYADFGEGEHCFSPVSDLGLDRLDMTDCDSVLRSSADGRTSVSIQCCHQLSLKTTQAQQSTMRSRHNRMQTSQNRQQSGVSGGYH